MFNQLRVTLTRLALLAIASGFAACGAADDKAGASSDAAAQYPTPESVLSEIDVLSERGPLRWSDVSEHVFLEKRATAGTGRIS